MPAWFSKVFAGGVGKIRTAEPAKTLDELLGGIDTSEGPVSASPRRNPPRRVVHAPVLNDEIEQTGWTADIRIKARVEPGSGVCVFMVDRPLSERYSAWFPNRDSAKESPLAQALFDIAGVETVTIHGLTVTVMRRPTIRGDWKPMAQEIGARIREHLIEGRPVFTEVFLDSLPPEREIHERLQRIIDTEINPSIAAHSGAIRLDRVEGNTVYLEMMGGCQGCAASAITLRQGIHEAFRSAVPRIGAILDVTDHTAGKNPFYKELPAGMT
jgi:Fe-S cluster biogenesis protein NfuA